jgi:hypothetical protein
VDTENFRPTTVPEAVKDKLGGNPDEGKAVQ